MTKTGAVLRHGRPPRNSSPRPRSSTSLPFSRIVGPGKRCVPCSPFIFLAKLIYYRLRRSLDCHSQHVEKTRYAKWRAAEISKALREGRQPTPVTSGEPAETAVDSVPAPPDPFAGLTDAPSTHLSHELEETHSTPALPLVSTAFGEEDTPLEIPPASAPVPINASDVQAQHTVLSGSPSPPSSIRSSPSMLRPHQVDAKSHTEVPPPPIAPYDPPVEMAQGQSRLTSTDAVSITPPTIQAQHPSSPTHIVPRSSPPPTAPYATGSPDASAPPLPPPPPAPYVQIQRPPPPPPEASPPPELTPGLIANTQKHCRFAISALDYEDAEQARKELRAALAILGG